MGQLTIYSPPDNTATCLSADRSGIPEETLRAENHSAGSYEHTYMITINSYGFIVGVAAVVWWSIAEYLEPKLKRVIPWILLLSLVGARVYHVFEYWDYYQADILAIPRVWEGGLSIWGALLFGGGYLAFRVKNMMWAVVTPLPLAQAIGRVANGVNGEFTHLVIGVPWWGMEAMLDLILFGLIWGMKKEWRVGGYLLGYGLIRLVLQPYRM